MYIDIIMNLIHARRALIVINLRAMNRNENEMRYTLSPAREIEQLIKSMHR